MKLALICFTQRGQDLAQRIKGDCSQQVNLFINSQIQGGVKPLIEEFWQNYEGLVFISSTGIAVRYIAPYLKDKKTDPAVVVIDDMGSFVISLVSGHLGGANRLSRDLAETLGAQAVVTTASDARGFQSLDLFCQDQDYEVEDWKSLTSLSGLMVDGKKLGFYSEEGAVPDYQNLTILESLGNSDEEIKGLIVVSTKVLDLPDKVPAAVLRPRRFNLGIGSRKGVEAQQVIKSIEELLLEEGISPRSLKAMATVEVKADEEGIIEAAEHFGLPLKIFSLEEIARVDHLFEGSDFVKKTIGVYSVSEPCAHLLGGSLIRRKVRRDGITLSLSKEE